MLYAVDVDYREGGAVAGAVGFSVWTAGVAATTTVVTLAPGQYGEYVPGQLYLRELPCLLAVLAAAPVPATAVVIDGYVWLEDGVPGLGARLHAALGGGVPVVGVAKTRYLSAMGALEVRRGSSASPLFVSAVGMGADAAAAAVASMHGAHRLPLLLKQADRLCRDHR